MHTLRLFPAVAVPYAPQRALCVYIYACIYDQLSELRGLSSLSDFALAAAADWTKRYCSMSVRMKKKKNNNDNNQIIDECAVDLVFLYLEMNHLCECRVASKMALDCGCGNMSSFTSSVKNISVERWSYIYFFHKLYECDLGPMNNIIMSIGGFVMTQKGPSIVKTSQFPAVNYKPRGSSVFYSQDANCQ